MSSSYGSTANGGGAGDGLDEQTTLPPSTAVKEPSPQPRQTNIPTNTFSIAEPQNGAHLSAETPLRVGSGGQRSARSLLLAGCCGADGEGGGAAFGKADAAGEKGLKAIVICMFVFAMGVTVALIIQILSGVAPPSSLEADHAVADHTKCTDLGNRIMERGGNAVDAAVASCFCMSLVAPHVTGIGGGGVMLIHDNRKNASRVIDFRETAPESARNDRFIENPQVARVGRGSIGVPGFIRGLAHAHANYGSKHVGRVCCSFSDLIWEAIRTASDINVTEHLVNATLTKINPAVFQTPEAENLANVFMPGGNPLSVTDKLRSSPVYTNLLLTLERLAKNGADDFYQGQVGADLVRDLEGVITMSDLNDYQVVEREPIETIIGQYRVLASPAPTSGPQLLAFLGAMEEHTKRYGLSNRDTSYMRNVTRVLDRSRELQLGLGDPMDEEVRRRTQFMLSEITAQRLLNPTFGDPVGFESSYPISSPVGAHVSAMDRLDTYVSVVTSLNTWFGSHVMTKNGVLLNNALANFAVPSEDSNDLRTANLLSTGRRPLTPNVVAVAMDAERPCGNRVAIGGATADAVGQVLAENLALNTTLHQAIEYARIEVQNGNVTLENVYDGSFDPRYVREFEKGSGDVDGISLTLTSLPYNAVNGLRKAKNEVYEYMDDRTGEPLPV